MASPELADELGITPLSDGYLVTLEQAADEGGIKPEFAARLIPIYRLGVPAPFPPGERCANCGAEWKAGHDCG